MNTDEEYMRRCLWLARKGRLLSRPNPMVGAVIVSRDGRILGEGYHARCGEGHAEVNAFGSVSHADRHLLADSTIYVSLEPCAHQGRTPPCADLIVSRGVRRCVVGTADPFARVQGRGIARLREYKGLAFLIEFYDVEYLQSMDETIDDLLTVCQKNGGGDGMTLYHCTDADISPIADDGVVLQLTNHATCGYDLRFNVSA